jgi:hypothetical protein
MGHVFVKLIPFSGEGRVISHLNGSTGGHDAIRTEKSLADFLDGSLPRVFE